MGSLNYAFAIRDGAKSTIARKGLKISSIFYISILLYTTGLFSVLPEGRAAALPYQALSLDIPAALAGLLATLGIITGIAGFTAAFGTLRNSTTVKEQLKSDNILSKSANMVLGGIAFILAVTAGWMAFIAPAFLLAGLLSYWGFYTIRDGENFYRSLIKSWKLTKDNRKNSIYLVSTLIILEVIVSLGAVFSGLTYLPLSAFIMSALGSVYITFSIACLASAFNEMQNTAED